MNFTFLDVWQIFNRCGEELDIIKKYGPRCAITDFSILLGGYVPDYHTNEDGTVSNFFTSEGTTGKDRAGLWWTKTSDWAEMNAVLYSYYNGYNNYSEFFRDVRFIGARPAITYSSIKFYSTNEVRGYKNITEIEYGEYPQTIVDENYSNELEMAYNSKSLKTTGKKYTTDSVKASDWSENDPGFKPRQHKEFEYNGSKYIRFIADTHKDGAVLSDGRTIKTGQAYWVRVEPITWLVDKKANIALSKRIIFAGVQWHHSRSRVDFDKSDIKKFMDNYFSHEIVSDKDYSQTLLRGQIQSIDDLPESIKMCLESMVSEKINEMFDPEVAINRAVDYYRNKGYTDELIKETLTGIVDRSKLTDIEKDSAYVKKLKKN